MNKIWAVASAFIVAAIPAAAAAQAAPKPYATNCQMCHQAGAKGVPGVYPRLTGRLDQIAAKPDGRKWLISVLLFGQSGKIMVDGKPVGGVMMPYGRLTDDDLATILTYVSKGKAKPFTAAEIKAVRGGEKLSPAKVAAERARLVTAGVIK